MKIENRFLKYISFNTQSDPSSQSIPSSTNQHDLADFLVEEMKILKFIDVEKDKNGIVYGTIPGNSKQGDIIGFMAHMDTSPDYTAENINPQIIRNYQGEIITINEEKKMYLDPQEFPELNTLIHHDLITTDGNTLLGADDKAGIAIIMTMAEYLYRHPEFKHNDIKVAFTVDEEVGKGANYFNIERMQADYAYTIDGSDMNEFSYENFIAHSAEVEIKGKSVHTGYAKDKMLNAIRIAQEFDQMLSQSKRPEYTSEDQGFIHLHEMIGDVSKTTYSYLLREFKEEKMLALMNEMDHAKDYLNQKYGPCIEIYYHKQYDNMAKLILEKMEIITQVSEAMEMIGLNPKPIYTRGGTDGAMLSYRGLLTPNLGTGGYNFHGPYEFVSITSMKKGVELLLQLIKNNHDRQ